MTKKKTTFEVAKQEVHAALSMHDLPTRVIAGRKSVYRVQEQQYSDPLYYNRNSDTRYGDPQKKIGTCYVSFSDRVALAETLQHGGSGAGSPVLQSEVEEGHCTIFKPLASWWWSMRRHWLATLAKPLAQSSSRADRAMKVMPTRKP